MLIVLPLPDSYPGLPPLLASDWSLSEGCWWERGGPWRSLALPSCMASHASLPSSWADRFSPTISLLCLQSPSLGRERGPKKVPGRAPGPARLPQLLSSSHSLSPQGLLHETGTSLGTSCPSPRHVLPHPTTCASPLASPRDGVLVPGGPAPSLPLPPSPSCSPASLEGCTFLVMVPLCSVSPGLRTFPHHQGPCLCCSSSPGPLGTLHPPEHSLFKI